MSVSLCNFLRAPVIQSELIDEKNTGYLNSEQV